MDRDSFLALLRQHRAIAVIRAPDLNRGLAMAEAAAAGGIHLIEITWNSFHPGDLVSKLRHRLPHCCIGVGTTLSKIDLQNAVEAGAQFCFCPHTDLAITQLAQRAEIPVVPGALTPNEVVTAWQAGATAVKVFPVSAVGGASYIRSLQGPLAHIPLIPTGGVTVDNAGDLLKAGAIAVGLSTGLFPPVAVEGQHWATIKTLAQQLVDTVASLDPST
ncbi:bifunctional 4-hydroxy-2-oxoglutarate aldolase/2-dehydro-3-deoxy-phosphogluconate aldolase [Leptolyngbya sp. CCNP1308]|uniref:bifunctional 4-hydroxy-2-oxoglutarate aldolase/2-dehydro-3-deoxy-phosphogluconate aldolase n=1 Tax=Leptolyngbya sp. CCNP1308 TaxID=3110255 RepID=UPI002B200209|nr:bifunctional 4-hydroxy-2-oxoglutarate aldolase/2-dehydro-3-deoxy-phosphogluconate aldolase [Leptolyngbya sp. CCNP1308]MEA5451664.1 bifunctional 4-hydroxy-2-oxoglutarate aldolase/2-dehydro-3-deoxy-phosphogluconate aldolase [Leptolyngbya sp. CCNP1308]